MYILLSISSFPALWLLHIQFNTFQELAAVFKLNNKTTDHLKRKAFMYPVSSIPYAVQKYLPLWNREKAAAQD